MTKEELADVLQDMANHVREGDSFDGSILYEMIGAGAFRVQAAYRIGNQQGQGGMTVIDTDSRGLESK